MSEDRTPKSSSPTIYACPTQVRVDGPYGSAGDLYACRELVLVAGGIGITPIHSVLSALLSAAAAGALRARPLSRVHVVWVVRWAPEFGGRLVSRLWENWIVQQ